MNRTPYKLKDTETEKDLCSRLNISAPTLRKWINKRENIFEKAKILNTFRKYKNLAGCWQNIQHRCSNPTDKRYKYYGGRGIKNLLTRIDLINIWEKCRADKMLRPSIDRINPDGNYEVANCRFIEFPDNCSRAKYHRHNKIVNRKKYFGIGLNHSEMILTEMLCKKYNLKCSDIFRMGLNTTKCERGCV